MKNHIILLFFVLFSSILFSQEHPKTQRTPLTITKNKTTFQDDYVWLENMKSEEVKNWVNKQNDLIYNNLDEINTKKTIISKIKEYDFLSTYSMPDRAGKYFYGMYRIDKNKPANLYLMKDIDAYPVEIVNISKIYPKDNVSVSDYQPSKNSKIIAYKINIDGSDKAEIRFADLEKHQPIDDILKNIKFSKIAWNGDKGVFYKKNNNNNQFEKDSTFQIFYHKIGFKQEDDELVFDTTKSEANLSFTTTKDKFFLFETNKEESKKSYYYADLDAETFVLKNFIENEDIKIKFITYKNGRVYFSSNESNWGEIKSFDLLNRKDEIQVIPQVYNHLLLNEYFTDNYIICKYKTLGKNYLMVYDYSGTFIKKIDVPNGNNIDFSFLDDQTKDLYFEVYSYTMPYQNFKINLETGIHKRFYKKDSEPKPIIFTLDHFETKIITYKNKDGIEVPITIIYKKGVVLDGNNPTLLKAYGGFGMVSNPYYNTGLLYFLEHGGIFAYAEIRGGGEKGINWHKDGMGLKKQNCFNDFIDAAEFLINQKYTSPNRLAITGGSQGGLLVGVAMTQRPELFKVAIPEVGVFDMAKFSNYTVGKYHNDEYGNPENELDFKKMMEYSPYHNIKEDVNYPITLIITSENDDRVPPVHSYKFAARLQNRAVQKNKIFLKTIKKAGHNGNISTYQKRIEEKAEFYSFLMFHLDMKL